jgi:hypothetical protein
MNRRSFSLGIVVLALALLCAGCTRSLPTYRYRLTVEVETPQGLRIGSSVIEVSGSDSYGGLPDANKINTKIRGEAVAVELPGGKVLFALLSSGPNGVGANGYALGAFPPSRRRVGNGAFAQDIEELKTRQGVGQLPRQARGIYPDRPEGAPPTAYPMLVTFKDLRDPKSVAPVDPDHLDTTFGPGVRLKRITAQMTADPITKGIEKRLGWINDYRNRHFDGSATISEDMTTQDLAAHLSSGSFGTEFAH